MCFRRSRPAFRWGATSVSQIAVSTASIWQKKGRMLENRCDRQCRSRRPVSGVTRQFAGIGNEPPLVHPFAHTVDDRGDFVLLLLRREPLALVEHQPDLLDL